MFKQVFRFIFCRFMYKNKVRFKFDSVIRKGSSFEGKNRLSNGVIFKGRLGYGSYIGKMSEISGDIGRFTSIGPYVRVNYGTHPFEAPFVTTSPLFYSISKVHSGFSYARSQKFNEYRFYDEKSKIAVVIGSDCWIGEGVLIIGGVKISDGAVVLARAVVTKDVPPFSIVGGVPASIIGYRYDAEIISKLLIKKEKK